MTEAKGNSRRNLNAGGTNSTNNSTPSSPKGASDGRKSSFGGGGGTSVSGSGGGGTPGTGTGTGTGTAGGAERLCSECGLNIPGRGLQTSNNMLYHLKCFTCDECKTELAGKKYGILPMGDGKDKRLCSECVEKFNQNRMRAMVLYLFIFVFFVFCFGFFVFFCDKMQFP